MKHSSFSIILPSDKDFLNIFWMLLNQIVPKASFLDFVGLVGWSGIHVMRHFMNCMSILEAIINPSVYLDKNLDQNWDWDSDSKVKAQGLLHSLKSTQNIVSFLVAKNALELIRPIAVKLQKHCRSIEYD